jgi:cytochrome b561
METVANSRYDLVSVWIHWITAALLIFMLIFGEELMETGEGVEGVGEAGEAGEALASTFGPSLHVSLGAAILGLTLLRVVWRLANPAPPYEVSMKSYERMLSRTVQGLFYVLLIAIPLTGWLAFGHLAGEEPAMAAVRKWPRTHVPPAPVTLGEAKELHEIGSNLAIALTVLHVLAALKHQFIDRDSILSRMRPL